MFRLTGKAVTAERKGKTLGNSTRRIDQTAAPPEQMSAINLYALLAIASVALAWANNEHVMTKEVFRALAGNPSLADAQFATVQRMRVWGYAMAPVQTAFRIMCTALIIQMTCLISGCEIGFGKTFRVAATAYSAVLFGSLLQILWIVKLPATAVTQASLGIVPDSLAAWLSTASDVPSTLYLILSRVSITSLLWLLLVYWGLGETRKLRPFGAATVGVTTWLIVSTVRVGTSLFLQELVA